MEPLALPICASERTWSTAIRALFAEGASTRPVNSFSARGSSTSACLSASLDTSRRASTVS